MDPLYTADKLQINGVTYQLGVRLPVQDYYRVYATLNSEPTLDTTTYVMDGETKTYEIGAVVRVVDNSSQTGYSFYRLHNITEYNHAIWAKLDMGLLELKETVTVNVTSNQDSDADLIGVAQITVNGVTQTYQGEPLVFYVPYNTSYTITASEVTDYTAYNNSAGTYTAQYWGARTATVQYCTEIVHITYDGYEINDERFSGGYVHISTSNSIIYTYYKSSSSPDIKKIPYGTQYTATGYLYPYVEDRYEVSAAPITRTASQPTVTINLESRQISDGIYVITKNFQDIVDIDSWDTADNGSAVGLLFVTENVKLGIKKRISPNEWTYNFSTYVPSYPNEWEDLTSVAQEDLITNYNGWRETSDLVDLFVDSTEDTGEPNYYIQKIILREDAAADGIGCMYFRPFSGDSEYQPTYEYLYTYTGTPRVFDEDATISYFSNPRFGSSGEWYAIYENKSEIESALSKIGSTYPTFDSYPYWTSTVAPTSSASLWAIQMSSGTFVDKGISGRNVNYYFFYDIT